MLPIDHAENLVVYKVMSAAASQGSFCYKFESQTLISQGSDDGGQNMNKVYQHEEHDELNWK